MLHWFMCAEERDRRDFNSPFHRVVKGNEYFLTSGVSAESDGSENVKEVQLFEPLEPWNV